MPRFPPIVLVISLSALAIGQAISRPDVPDSIKAPSGELVVLWAHATGAQLYVCQQSPDGKLGWSLKAPEAELHDPQGATIARHYAGPTWKNEDGSEVTGKAIAKADSPEPDSIPWLLVKATGHSGNGAFSQITNIQRIHTHGGQPPNDACSAANLERKSSYSADYYFYAPSR